MRNADIKDSSPFLPDRIEVWATERADRLAFAFPTRSGGIELTWKEAHDQIDALAGHLHGHGVGPGETVLILTASPREQILSFLAALRCGAMPSILSYPSVKQTESRFLDTFRKIAAASNARFLFASREFEPVVGGQAKQLGFLPIPDPTTLPRVDVPELVPPENLFLQFSSGTTGIRKSLIVTQKMFASYMGGYSKALAVSPEDRIVNWLPLYHDMGLIAAFLAAVHDGIGAVHLSPFEWLKDPSLFIQCASRYRATLAWLPNFAFKFLADRVTDEELKDVRLDSMRAILNGGEVNRAESIRDFLQRFSPYGVRPAAMKSIYGMAESVMSVTQTPIDSMLRIDRVDADELLVHRRAVPAGSGLGRTLEHVSSGRPFENVQLRIGGTTEERVVGEIELRGECVAMGYRGESSWPPGIGTDDGFFRTGDLGYIADGEVYVTGRKKDLIIHCGVNLHPIDLEEIVDAVKGIKPGRTVAFGVPDPENGTEHVVILAETAEKTAAEDHGALVRAAREAIRTRMGIPVSDIVLHAPGTLVKSTSGKLSRVANREAYLARPRSVAPVETPEITPASTTEPAVETVIGIWKRILRTAKVEPDDDFLDLGGTSLGLADVAARIRDTFGVDLPLQTLFEERTPARQATAVTAAREAGVAPVPRTRAFARSLVTRSESRSSMATEALLDAMSNVGVQLMTDGERLETYALEGRISDELRHEIAAHAEQLSAALATVGKGRFTPLAPFQERLMKAYVNPNFNIAGSLRLSGALDAGKLEAAFRALAQQNDALRTVFPTVLGRMFARVVAEPSLGFEVIDLSSLAPVEQAAAIERAGRATRDPGVFDFARGPLLALRLFRLAAEEHTLLMIMNHATQDGLSLPFVFSDVSALYRGDLPPVRKQFSDALLVEQGEYSAAATERELAAWRDRHLGLPPAFTLASRPVEEGPRHGELVARDVEPAVVTALASVAAKERVSLATMLLGLFEAAIVQTTGKTDVLHGVTALNRNVANRDAIGSFGKGNPCRFLLEGKTIGEILQHVNERVLWLLDNDRPQMTRFLAENKVPPTLVNFNYISIPGEELQLDLESVRCSAIDWYRRGTSNHPMLRDMAVFIVHRGDGGIRVNCSYDTAIHDEATVNALVASYLGLLGDVLADPRTLLTSTPRPNRGNT